MLLLILVIIGVLAWMACSSERRMFTAAIIAGIFIPILVAADWLHSRIIFTRFIGESLRSISGVNPSSSGIVQECSRRSLSIGLVLLIFAVIVALACANLLLFLAAVIGTPTGVFLSGVGTLRAILTGRPQTLRLGLTILVYGLGAIILAALLMRIMHALSGIGCPA